MTRTLLTGATGMLGHHLARALLDRGDQVVATRRATSDIGPLADCAIDWRTADLSDCSALERAAEGCETAFHCAAQVSFQGADRAALTTANVEGTETLLRAARAAGLARVVHVSSIAAMGYAEDGPANECTPYNHRPGMAYNETKRDAELAARAAAAGALDLMIVRPTLISGPGPFRRGAVASLIQRSLRQRMWVSPCGGVNVVDVRDVVLMLLAAMDRGRDGETYLAAGHNIGTYGLITTIGKQTGRGPARVSSPRWLTDGVSRICRTAESFGMRPPVPADTLRLAGLSLYYDNRWSLETLGLAQPLNLYDTLKRQIDWERQANTC
jgi:dihydroflavonol-4-reductase